MKEYGMNVFDGCIWMGGVLVKDSSDHCDLRNSYSSI